MRGYYRKDDNDEDDDDRAKEITDKYIHKDRDAPTTVEARDAQNHMVYAWLTKTYRTPQQMLWVLDIVRGRIWEMTEKKPEHCQTRVLLKDETISWVNNTGSDVLDALRKRYLKLDADGKKCWIHESHDGTAFDPCTRCVCSLPENECECVNLDVAKRTTTLLAYQVVFRSVITPGVVLCNRCHREHRRADQNMQIVLQPVLGELERYFADQRREQERGN